MTRSKSRAHQNDSPLSLYLRLLSSSYSQPSSNRRSCPSSRRSPSGGSRCRVSCGGHGSLLRNHREDVSSVSSLEVGRPFGSSSYAHDEEEDENDDCDGYGCDDVGDVGTCSSS